MLVEIRFDHRVFEKGRLSADRRVLCMDIARIFVSYKLLRRLNNRHEFNPTDVERNQSVEQLTVAKDSTTVDTQRTIASGSER